VTLDALMQCTDVSTSIKELHEEFSPVPFSHCVVATDLAVIEKHLVAELPVSLKCKESISDYYGNSSEIFHSCCQSIFLFA